jgi:hypothetical protein
MTKRSENVVKMQRLRRAVERLRNVKSSPPPPPQKKSWLERLKSRLGLGSSDEDKA